MRITPDPIDQHVGRMIRARRRMLRLSQHQLAAALGLTFQQVQKYERGLNRISASKLFVTARALKCVPAYFFQGLALDAPSDDVEASFNVMLQLTGEGGGVELAQRYLRMEPHQQRALLNIARVVSPDALAEAAVGEAAAA